MGILQGIPIQDYCHKYLKGRFIFPKYVFYYDTSNKITCITFEVHVYVDKVLSHIKNHS
jgi:hypothetical protein